MVSDWKILKAAGFKSLPSDTSGRLAFESFTQALYQRHWFFSMLAVHVRVKFVDHQAERSYGLAGISHQTSSWLVNTHQRTTKNDWRNIYSQSQWTGPSARSCRNFAILDDCNLTNLEIHFPAYKRRSVNQSTERLNVIFRRKNTGQGRVHTLHTPPALTDP